MKRQSYTYVIRGLTPGEEASTTGIVCPDNFVPEFVDQYVGEKGEELYTATWKIDKGAEQ